MLDIAYVLATIAFFTLMLAFVRGLVLLGREPGDQHGTRS
jgi:hypothetical protein